MTEIFGQSKTAAEMRKMLKNVSADQNYLIGGEPGTGKNFLARLIAAKIDKKRVDKLIVKIKKGRDFKKSASVFITEKRELFDLLSPKFNNKIWLAPLRERLTDLAELIEHFIQESGVDSKRWYNQKSMQSLISYWWPYNIQELKRVVTTEEGYKLLPYENISAILSNYSATEIVTIKIESFWQELGKRANPGKIYQLFLESIEKVFIESALKKCGGSIIKTAALLNIHRNTLTQKIKRLKIKNG